MILPFEMAANLTFSMACKGSIEFQTEKWIIHGLYEG